MLCVCVRFFFFFFFFFFSLIVRACVCGGSLPDIWFPGYKFSPVNLSQKYLKTILRTVAVALVIMILKLNIYMNEI